ncbi:MAG: hypothetical protein WCA35_23975 [Kovacikia sp.]
MQFNTGSTGLRNLSLKKSGGRSQETCSIACLQTLRVGIAHLTHPSAREGV